MAKFLQFVMFAVNIVFWAIGGVMMGVGIWLAVDDSAFAAFNLPESGGMNDGVWKAAVIIIITVGAFLFVVGFLGCVGAMRADRPGSNCPLVLYIIIVKFIIILEIVAIILTAVFWNSINDKVKTSMTKDVQERYVNETEQDGRSVAWNRMQVSWKCCGGANYTDYRNSFYANNTDPLQVPWTCCVLKKGKNGKSKEDPVNWEGCVTEAKKPYDETVANNFTYLYGRGCYDGLNDYIDSNAALLIGLTCGFIGLEIFGIIFACILRRGNNSARD